MTRDTHYKKMIGTPKVFALDVLGTAVGQGRPRFCARGKFVRAYDPKKSADAKQLIRALATQKVQEMGWNMLGPKVPVKIEIDEYRQIPGSLRAYEKGAAYGGYIVPLGKPDCDNVEKLIMDALSGLVYCDDKQVFDLHYRRHYCDEDHKSPMTRISVSMYYIDVADVKDVGERIYKANKERLNGHV